jgi:hypothetical protein
MQSGLHSRVVGDGNRSVIRRPNFYAPDCGMGAQTAPFNVSCDFRPQGQPRYNLVPSLGFGQQVVDLETASTVPLVTAELNGFAALNSVSYGLSTWKSDGREIYPPSCTTPAFNYLHNQPRNTANDSPPVLASSRNVSSLIAKRRRHQCTLPGCSATFTRVADRKRHLETIHGNGVRYFCPQRGYTKGCGTGYTRFDKLQEHMNKKHPGTPLQNFM